MDKSTKLEPLNMHGHANTWEEELLETAREREELRAENERLRAVAQAAHDAYLAWTKDRSQEDLDSCMTILCAVLDTWDTWREQNG
jgi:hypothetical protein